MSAVDACMTIFVSSALEKIVWQDDFYPTVASVRPRLRSFEEEIRETLRAAGLKPDAVKGDSSDDDEDESIAEKKSSEMEAFIKCVKGMWKTVFPRMMEEIVSWDGCIRIR
jgi:hypothetical protein